MPESIKEKELKEQNAYHEAGHLAALYRCNKHNNFPGAFLPDDIKLLCCNNTAPDDPFQDKSENSVLPISGVRNIIIPPVSIIEARKIKPLFDKRSYQPAYRANIINLLAGPLAEAKHISLRDDESFNAQLIHASALRFYNGTNDLEKAYEHLSQHMKYPHLSKEVITELFSNAFVFIDEPANWKAIASLANYILKNNTNTISCIEAFTLLDESVEILKKALIKADSMVPLSLNDY